ncbi:MAG: NADH-quinone oxidoreductase subunit C [Chloroflexi bacterium]|nr:NADH-quinone oxidoreductase subunit C [Chloroflexota bacterium]|tara:strand:- start:216 stop:803 length:588 start_codon:yes stop_codon:yes gene_type:complete
MPNGPNQLKSKIVADALSNAIPGIVKNVADNWVEVDVQQIETCLLWLRQSEKFDAAQLSNLCGIDYHDHFMVVYHLQSLDLNHQIVIKVRIDEHEDPVVPSVVAIYKGALLQEREAYDLMGIKFENHPDMRRLFLWDGFPGHPLRKDFLGIGEGRTSGLNRFPFENESDPVRAINQDNRIDEDNSQESPPLWSGV